MARIIPSVSLIAGILITVSALCQTAWCADDRVQQIEELMRRFSSERHFSGAVLVAENGEVIFEGAYGLADIDAKTPVTPQMSFCIGSMSKQFAAMAAMQLVEKGTETGRSGDQLPARLSVGQRRLDHHTPFVESHFRDSPG